MFQCEGFTSLENSIVNIYQDLDLAGLVKHPGVNLEASVLIGSNIVRLHHHPNGYLLLVSAHQSDDFAIAVYDSYARLYDQDVPDVSVGDILLGPARLRFENVRGHVNNTVNPHIISFGRSYSPDAIPGHSGIKYVRIVGIV